MNNEVEDLRKDGSIATALEDFITRMKEEAERVIKPLKLASTISLLLFIASIILFLQTSCSLIEDSDFLAALFPNDLPDISDEIITPEVTDTTNKEFVLVSGNQTIAWTIEEKDNEIVVSSPGCSFLHTITADDLPEHCDEAELIKLSLDEDGKLIIWTINDGSSTYIRR